MYAIAAEPYSLLKLWHGRIYHADMLGIIALRYSLSTCWQSGFTVSSWSRLTWSWQEAWDMISLGLYCCEWIWVCWKHAGNGGSDVTDRGKSLAMLIVVVLASLVEGKLALLISVHLDSEEEARLQCVLLWCVQPERGESDFARSSETGFTGSGEYELAGTSGSGCTGSWHEALNLVDLASLVAVDLGLLRMKVWACCEWRSGLAVNEGLGCPGQCAFILAGTKLIMVDLFGLVIVNLASPVVVNLSSHPAVDLASPVVVDLALAVVVDPYLHLPMDLALPVKVNLTLHVAVDLA